MWRAPYRNKVQYNAFIRRFSTEFLFATFLAYAISFIWNCLYSIYVSKFIDNSEISIKAPIIERWILWNSIFFFIFITISKLILKRYLNCNRQRYNMNVVLQRYGIIPILDVCILAQFFVFFTPNGFLVYLILPIHHIIVNILDKLRLRKQIYLSFIFFLFQP